MIIDNYVILYCIVSHWLTLHRSSSAPVVHTLANVTHVYYMCDTNVIYAWPFRCIVHIYM